MIEFQAKVEKLGGSYAVVIPKGIVKKAGLKVGTKITLWITEDYNLVNFRGALKNMEKKCAEEIIKEVKKGWNKKKN